MYARASDDAGLSESQVAEALATTFEALPLDGKRVLVIIPDSTRTAPIPLIFRLLGETLGQRVSRLDYLIALGTHPPMSVEAVDRLVGVPAGGARRALSAHDRLQPSVGPARRAGDYRDHLARGDAAAY